MRPNAPLASTCITLLTAFALATPARAQQAPAPEAGARAVWFPHNPLFGAPLADPHSPRFAGAFIVTNILSQESPERAPFPVNAPSDQELMAVVNLGGTYPIVRTPWRQGSFEFGGQVGMDTRFRMKLRQKDMYSADWMVAAAFSLAEGPWSGRARAIHRSSHMGDQFEQATGARRIQLGSDGFDLYGARQLGPVRAYAGGEWIAYSETDDQALPEGGADVWQAQAGVDLGWDAWKAHPAWQVVGGLDWQSAQRTDWQPSFAAEGGVRFSHGDRSARLVVRAFNGVSEVYQFFRTKEKFIGLELVVNP